MRENEFAVLVFGRGGQVATELARAAVPGITVIATGRPDADITDSALVQSALDRVRPHIVVNAAAYTAVDLAEKESDKAFAVNAEGAANIARACARRNVPLIHISTDYVFDGEKNGPYREDDSVAPLSAYGRSKEAGERAVRELCPRHAILRTAWVYSPFGNNFVKTMLRLGHEREKLGIVDDQRGSPTAARSIAAAVLAMAGALGRDPDHAAGTFHFVDGGETTWFGFAQAIFERVAATGQKVPSIDAITTAQYPTPAQRPRNSVLDCARIGTEFGVTQRPWRSCLADCLDELLTETKA